jgi:hypothetical protein
MAMDSQEMEKEITCLLTSDPDRFILIRGELENQEAEGSSVSGHIANPFRDFFNHSYYTLCNRKNNPQIF